MSTAMPKVGETITVVYRNKGHAPVFVPAWNAFTPKAPDTITFTGVVMKRDYWMKTDEFNLSTDMPLYPVRTLSMKNIISINGAKANGQPTKEDVKVVNVAGSKGASYEVIVRNGVAETCTCPAFRFRGGRCKHLSIAV